jgi:16S rRNA (cytosine967-C5)-methyltransferase
MSGPRDAAVRVLGAVLSGGGYSDTILDILLSRDRTLSAEDRALATEITYGALRNLGRIDYVLSRFSKRPAASLDPEIQNILRVAIYQIHFLEKIPPYAVVDEAVRLAEVFGKRSAGSFINGVLRSALRGIKTVDFPSETADPEGFLVVCCSLPRWLSRFLLERFGSERAVVIGRRYVGRPPVVLRANTLKVTRQGLTEELTKRGYDAHETSRSRFGVVVRGGGALFKTDLYKNGSFSLQDEASQLACPSLGVEPGMRVLDACAAPGIKGTFCAELMADRGTVVSVEINHTRAVQTAENARRLEICRLSVVRADITRPPFRAGAAFDRVLVDPPCSGLGVIRRNPEIKWRLKPADLPALVGVQRRILSSAAEFVRPAGVLVYAVCTINPDEGAGVVEEFLRSHGEFTRDDVAPILGPECAPFIEEGAVFTTPDRFSESDDAIPDGFYIARLKKK